MVDIDIERDELIVRLSGWDRWLALRRTVRVPLVSIKEIAPAPELIDARPQGMKLPGSYVPGWPGPIFAGTFVEQGSIRTRSFWSLRRATADQILWLETDDSPESGQYRTLVLQVADASATAGRITREIERRRG